MDSKKQMSRLQFWLGIGTMAFVFVYLSAIALTVSSRLEVEEKTPTIESTRIREAERHLALPELLLPMAIILALSVSFLVVKRRNARNYEMLDDDLEEPEQLE